MTVSPQKTRWWLLAAVLAFVLILDQVTKRIAIDALPLGFSVQPIPALAPYFQFTRSFNTGAAFGILPQSGVILGLVAIGVVIGMIWFYPRLHSNRARIAIGLVCGGALGNVLDRFAYEAVVDFIHYQIPGVISNVSNLADHGIVFGVLILVVESWRGSESSTADGGSAENPKTTTIEPDSSAIEE